MEKMFKNVQHLRGAGNSTCFIPYFLNLAIQVLAWVN